MENEKGLYVALGVYIGELQKRADLKNDEIRKSVHIGHSTFNDLKTRSQQAGSMIASELKQDSLPVAIYIDKNLVSV